MNEVLKFNDFLNEEINITTYDNGVCRLSDRWFYYNLDDDIVYGCDEKPVLNDNILFAFNPVSCTVLLNGKESRYDVNNEVFFYTDNALEFVQIKYNFPGKDLTSTRSRNRLEYIFQNQDDDKFLLVYGDQLIASTFDVIEEN